MTDDEALREGCRVLGWKLDRVGKGWRVTDDDGVGYSLGARCLPAYAAESLVAKAIGESVFRVEYGEPKPGMARAWMFTDPSAPGWITQARVTGAGFSNVTIRAALVALGHEAAGEVE